MGNVPERRIAGVVVEVFRHNRHNDKFLSRCIRWHTHITRRGREDIATQCGCQGVGTSDQAGDSIGASSISRGTDSRTSRDSNARERVIADISYMTEDGVGWLRPISWRDSYCISTCVVPYTTIAYSKVERSP